MGIVNKEKSSFEESLISDLISEPLNKDWKMNLPEQSEPTKYKDGSKITEKSKELETVVNNDYSDIAKIILTKNRELFAFYCELKDDYTTMWSEEKEYQPYVGEAVLRLKDACDNLTQAGNALFQMKSLFEKEMVELPEIKLNNGRQLVEKYENELKKIVEEGYGAS